MKTILASLALGAILALICGSPCLSQPTLNTDSLVVGKSAPHTSTAPSESLSSFTAGEVGVMISWCVSWNGSAPATISGCTSWTLATGGTFESGPEEATFQIWTCYCNTTATGKKIYGAQPDDGNSAFIFWAFDGCTSDYDVSGAFAAPELSSGPVDDPSISWSAGYSDCILVGGIMQNATEESGFDTWIDISTDDYYVENMTGEVSTDDTYGPGTVSVVFDCEPDTYPPMVGIALSAG